MVSALVLARSQRRVIGSKQNLIHSCGAFGPDPGWRRRVGVKRGPMAGSTKFRTAFPH
jgi:hypothetical protein